MSSLFCSHFHFKFSLYIVRVLSLRIGSNESREGTAVSLARSSQCLVRVLEAAISLTGKW